MGVELDGGSSPCWPEGRDSGRGASRIDCDPVLGKVVEEEANVEDEDAGTKRSDATIRISPEKKLLAEQALAMADNAIQLLMDSNRSVVREEFGNGVISYDDYDGQQL